VIGVQSKLSIKDRSILSLVYTPGVAAPCLAIAEEPRKFFSATCRGNTIAIATDGSRVVGLGNAGPLAAYPIMEAKSVIFKTFAGVDAFPICIDAPSMDNFINTVTLLGPTFGAICLEDIASPYCFLIEQCLNSSMNIPVFHNDQHGAAIEVLAGLINACKLVKKRLEDLRVVINGAGAAGIATAKMLLRTGVEDVILCDRRGAIFKYRLEGMNWAKHEMARITNKRQLEGSLAEVLPGADVFVGLSAGGVLTEEIVSTMSENPIVFALALPEPEINPEEAKAAGASVVATGRADYPNELDIALVFPGVFRGVLDVQARNINWLMLKAAAEALASLVPEDSLGPERIVPEVFDYQVAPTIAAAVAREAIASGFARVETSPEKVYERTLRYVYEGHFPHPPREHKKELSMDEEAIELHERFGGVVEIRNKIPVKDSSSLKDLYLPPAAIAPAKAILEDPMSVFDYTCKSNLVAIVSDGSAVLGLGNIGPRAALPVMEGKAVLFHTYAGVEAFPICISTQNVEEIIEVVAQISPTFGGINLEDISAPRCFEVEKRLKEMLDIPVFHDDQHGTAVVVLGGLLNALKLSGRSLEASRIVINGAGAGAIAVAKLLIISGAKDLTLCDSKGAIYPGREFGMNWAKEEMASMTNPRGLKGPLADVVLGAEVFIGLSIAGALSQDAVRSMVPEPIIFALANPVPEIMPDEAKAAGAFIVATGRSDFLNQVNNALAFPGIFRGALDARATEINTSMKTAAAHALASAVSKQELAENQILPSAMNFHVPADVAAATAKAAMETGVARRSVDPAMIRENTLDFLYEGHLAVME
jgi:malate dehydrogenase (oxaloacetate-decarboxylating)